MLRKNKISMISPINLSVNLNKEKSSSYLNLLLKPDYKYTSMIS